MGGNQASVDKKMANMKMVNAAIKKQFPESDIVAVRGFGYVYFDGDDGFDKVESIMVNPTTTDTTYLIQIFQYEISRSIVL